MSQDRKIYGMTARYAGPAELLNAAEQLRLTGYRQFDVHSPFPIHGMNEAMGLTRSRVGYIAGLGALLGGGGIFTLMTWASVKAYPLVISGKPFFSYQAFFPITFASAVLVAAFGALFGFMALSGVRYHHPLFNSQLVGRVTDDGFVVSVSAEDPKFDSTATAEFLRTLGAVEIELVEDA